MIVFFILVCHNMASVGKQNQQLLYYQDKLICTNQRKNTETYTHISTACPRVRRRAHMHFRGVPLIQHEIQFKTWSASCSPALIEYQISTENRAGLLRRTYVDVSASKRAFEKYVCLHGLFSSLVLGKCLELFCKCCCYIYSFFLFRSC